MKRVNKHRLRVLTDRIPRILVNLCFAGTNQKMLRVIKPYEFKTYPEVIPIQNVKKKNLEDTRRQHDEAWPGRSRPELGRVLAQVGRVMAEAIRAQLLEHSSNRH